MRVSGRHWWSLVGAIASTIGLVLALATGAAANVGATSKVIVYPTAQDSIAQLKQDGITDVQNYGAYWVVQATDAQVRALKQRHGDRVVPADFLNRIELRSMTLDTTTVEPAGPGNLGQMTPSGRRLRLIQFKGPIQPEWLNQVKAVAGARIMSYVPNNAYVVSLDQKAEDSLKRLTAPAGPIQWIGAYDPYYKMDPMLSSVAAPAVQVQIDLVNGPDAGKTLEAIRGYTLEQTAKPGAMGEEILLGIETSPTNLVSIAQLPDVLWIARCAPMERRDEVQSLIIADRISGPGNGPVPGVDDYLDFLTNVVGVSTNPADYPVLDVADTAAYDTIAYFTDFYEFGNPTNAIRITGLNDMLGTTETACENLHGPFVMSVASGYNDARDTVNLDASGFRKGLGVSPFGRVSNTWLFKTGSGGYPCVYSPPNDVHPTPDGVSEIAINEYLGTGARISNCSWDQGIEFNGVGGQGGGNVGSYDATALGFDRTVRGFGYSLSATGGVPPTPFPLNVEMITVFAAGGTGGADANGGFAEGIITPPSTAKNVISVGSSENVRLDLEEAELECDLLPSDCDNSLALSSISPYGPTVDGRIKPEIVAPGTAIFGVYGTGLTNFVLVGTNEVSTFGTAYICDNGLLLEAGGPAVINEAAAPSYSAPAVSAAAQLLWWYFEHRLLNEQGQNYLQPSPAMAKAYLCNSARYLPITDPSTGALDTLPSIAQGMGELDLATMFDGVPRILRDETTPRAIDTPLITTNPVPQQTYFSRSGQSYQVSGQVADPTEPFRVSLAWTDAPGNPSAFYQLVNSLNLEVTIGGQTYLGNVFTGPNSVTGGQPDSINNMQSVFLPPGETGAWSVVVRAMNIVSNAVPNIPHATVGQDFALVVYNAATTNRSDVPNLATNDSCQTAINITNYPFSSTNTLSAGVYHKTLPSPTAGTGGIEEFFKLENPSPPTPGTTFTIDTFGSSFDTLLSVWQVHVIPSAVNVRGDCGILQELVSNNEAGEGLLSSVTFTSDGSNDYYVVAEAHNNGPGGTLVLNVNASASLITLTPSSLTFDDQVQGTTSAVQTVTYQNGYPVAVTVNSVTIAGADPADFTIISDGCVGAPLLTGTNCLVGVAFTPQATGTRTANLVFTDTATGSPRVVPLSGSGLSPAPLICLGSSGGILFTNTPVNVTSAPQTIVITNCGTAALTISSVTFTGNATNDFSEVPSCTLNTPIAPGSSCSIAVRFTPSVAGLRQATLLIGNNVNPSVPISILCEGTGFSPAPVLCVDNSVSFGSFLVGSTGLVQTLIITNCGTTALVISNSPVLIAGDTGDFIVASSTCATVPTGGTCAVSLQFAPTAGGARSATLAITDNIIGGPQLVTLSGNGALSQPDAAIGKNTNLKKMVGFGVIANASSAAQEISQNVHREAPAAIEDGKGGVTFYVAVKNIGTSADQFLVQGQQVGNVTQGFTVKYFLGASSNPSESVDVTAAVNAGTFASATLEAGAVTGDATMIRVVIYADKTVAKETTTYFALTFTSASDSTKQDTVTAEVVAK
jgi:hypothetical protein